MAAQRPARARRSQLRLQKLNDALGPKLAASLAEVTRPAPTRLGVLRAFRRLSKLDLGSAERNTLREVFTTAFERIVKESSGKEPVRPADFGLRSRRELAELFVTALEGSGYAKRRVKDLRRVRSHVVGELLEVLVRNSPELQPDLRRMAWMQVDILNSPKTGLLDAHGANVTMKEPFGAPRMATNLLIRGRGGRKKFIDFVLVSEGVDTAGRRVFAIATEVEVKMPRAAQKAGGQIGRAQARFNLRRGEKLLLDVEGVGHQELRADQIVFALTSRDRFLVTIGPKENVRLRRTRKGGYAEAFWEVELDLKAAALKRLVDLAMP